ncbi:hypothetical protein [Sporomusa malonica]|uniref:PEP-CTERM protein-sorting domain-containing protein n=1 Tax=Sporomusa malonica TaxID=112901 RepID=A0A1W2ARM6_9FIRM|nr:hypothetical protein [Sporomusa malonica]SMC63389.1 hypothetical protein SAMN04488500_10671 [Sporomusa malonica]
MIYIKKVINYIDDALLLAGIAFISGGIFMLSVPCGFISVGIGCLAMGYLVAKRRGV